MYESHKEREQAPDVRPFQVFALGSFGQPRQRSMRLQKKRRHRWATGGLLAGVVASPAQATYKRPTLALGERKIWRVSLFRRSVAQEP